MPFSENLTTLCDNSDDDGHGNDDGDDDDDDDADDEPTLGCQGIAGIVMVSEKPLDPL